MGTTATEVEVLGGIAAPLVSVAGKSAAYFDSTQLIKKISQNAGVYVPVVEQTGFAELAADTSTNSATFADLLSVTLTARGNTRFVCEFTCGCSVATLLGQGLFRLLVDGVVTRGVGVQLLAVAAPLSCALVFRSAVLTSGARIAKMQWRCSAVNLGLQIRPVTAPDSEHASLYVREVSG